MMTNIMVHAVVWEQKLSAANAAAIWANGRTSFCSKTHKFVGVNQQNENLSEDNFPPQVSKHQSYKEEAKMYKCESFFVWVTKTPQLYPLSAAVLVETNCSATQKKNAHILNIQTSCLMKDAFSSHQPNKRRLKK